MANDENLHLKHDITTPFLFKFTELFRTLKGCIYNKVKSNILLFTILSNFQPQGYNFAKYCTFITLQCNSSLFFLI
jgi:hypothetical protein